MLFTEWERISTGFSLLFVFICTAVKDIIIKTGSVDLPLIFSLCLLCLILCLQPHKSWSFCVLGERWLFVLLMLVVLFTITD
jgi:hypothetical protein